MAQAITTPRPRGLIFELARNDFRARYTGSLLGATWAFAQPMLTIGLYLFIYQVGFRSSPPAEVPFVLWLIVGIAPWFFFSDALVGSTSSLVEYSFLVKKVLFDVTSVPTIKVLSSAFVHAIVWTIVVLITLVTGPSPKLSWIFVPYYFAAMYLFVSAIGRFFAAITPFLRDVAQVVGAGLQFFFWLTPVLWPISNAPPRLVPLLEANPLYYVIDGLRDALLLGRAPWYHPYRTLYFWAVVGALTLLARAVFRSVRPHLADVL
jgi:ABC-type polysaccharide/polyol phosphate export permease